MIVLCGIQHSRSLNVCKEMIVCAIGEQDYTLLVKNDSFAKMGKK